MEDYLSQIVGILKSEIDRETFIILRFDAFVKFIFSFKMYSFA